MYAATAYEEIIDFIASGTSPEKVIAFRPSESLQSRVSDLLFRNQNESLNSEEKSELESYMLLEHIMRLAKARAFKILAA
jgi:hypothetical protein